MIYYEYKQGSIKRKGDYVIVIHSNSKFHGRYGRIVKVTPTNVSIYFEDGKGQSLTPTGKKYVKDPTQYIEPKFRKKYLHSSVKQEYLRLI